jgi:molybdenum cofactor cytidylyltransferase
MTQAAVILAAGEGTRFDGPRHKLLAPLRGRPVVSWAIDAARRAGLDETIVVVGAVDLVDTIPDDVTVVVNDRWASGQATSLAAAIDAVADRHDAVVVALGDQPFLEPGAWSAVAACHDAAIAVATYDGRRGHPVRLDRSVWPLLARTGDAGARDLMRERPHLVREVPCLGQPADIDTREDLARWS